MVSGAVSTNNANYTLAYWLQIAPRLNGNTRQVREHVTDISLHHKVTLSLHIIVLDSGEKSILLVAS